MQLLFSSLKILFISGDYMEHSSYVNLKNGFKIYEKYYDYRAKYGDKRPSTEKYHIHNCHEVFLLLEGNADYIAEGTVFPLNVRDFAIIGSGTPHGKNLIKTPALKCFVMMLDHDFFVNNNCEEYEQIFLSLASTEHKISADICENSGFFGAYQRLKSYTKNFSDTSSPITTAIITEMLYILNNSIEFSKSYITNSQVQRIFDYVNDNFTKKITLEDISGKMFISKYHICKLFKKHAGYTVYQYITQKRIERTRQLVSEGKNITSACIEAGFSDYSSFYKAYLKENATSPKDMIKTQN